MDYELERSDLTSAIRSWKKTENGDRHQNSKINPNVAKWRKVALVYVRIYEKMCHRYQW